MSGRGLGRFHRRLDTVEVVPERLLGAFAEARLTDELYSRWESHAYDALPQFEGVMEGDWAAAGYDMDKEFPQVSMLANDFGKEWEVFARRRDEDEVVWVISRGFDEDEFNELVEAFLDSDEYGDSPEWRDIDTKEAVDKTVKDFQYVVRKKVAELEGEGKDEDEE